MAPGILSLVKAIDWSMPWAEILETLSTVGAGTPRISKAAVENALVDGIARARGVTAAEFLGGEWREELVAGFESATHGIDNESQTNAACRHATTCANPLLRRLCHPAQLRSLTLTEADFKVAAHAGRGSPNLSSSYNGRTGRPG